MIIFKHHNTKRNANNRTKFALVLRPYPPRQEYARLCTKIHGLLINSQNHLIHCLEAVLRENFVKMVRLVVAHNLCVLCSENPHNTAFYSPDIATRNFFRLYNRKKTVYTVCVDEERFKDDCSLSLERVNVFDFRIDLFLHASSENDTE